MTAPAPDGGSIEALVGMHRVLLRVSPEPATGGISLSVRDNGHMVLEVVLAPVAAVDLALRLIGAHKQLQEGGHD